MSNANSFVNRTILALAGAFMPPITIPLISTDRRHAPVWHPVPKGDKGQKRSMRPKPSKRAAASKRAATKRNNIRKHS